MSLQVYNETTKPLLATNAITLTDTQGNVYRPIPIRPHEPVRLPRRGRALERACSRSRARPPACSAAQGQVLLFKIATISLDNRPLEMKIVNPLNPHSSASAELDV